MMKQKEDILRMYQGFNKRIGKREVIKCEFEVIAKTGREETRRL